MEGVLRHTVARVAVARGFYAEEQVVRSRKPHSELYIFDNLGHDHARRRDAEPAILKLDCVVPNRSVQESGKEKWAAEGSGERFPFIRSGPAAGVARQTLVTRYRRHEKYARVEPQGRLAHHRDDGSRSPVLTDAIPPLVRVQDRRHGGDKLFDLLSPREQNPITS